METKTSNNTGLKQYFKDILDKPNWQIFLITWLFYLLGMFIFTYFVWDSNTYLANYAGNDFTRHLSKMRELDIIRYALSLVWVFFVFLLTYSAFKIGEIIFQINISNKVLVNIILLGLCFVFAKYWEKSIWLILIEGSYGPDDAQNCFLLSVASIVDRNNYNLAVIKVFDSIHLNQLFFVLFTSWLISLKTELSYLKSFFTTFIIYGFSFSILKLILIFIAI